MRLFGAIKSEEGEDLHITLESHELWPSVLEELRRKHEHVAQGAEWAAPASDRWRERILTLLQGLDDALPKKGSPFNSTGNTTMLRKALGTLKTELSKVHKKAMAAKEEAAKLQREAEKAATIARLKASLKRAPWDKDALSANVRA